MARRRCNYTSLYFALLVVGGILNDCKGFVVKPAGVSAVSSLRQNCRCCIDSASSFSRTSIRMGNDKDEKEKEDEDDGLLTWEELSADPKMSQKEQEASNKLAFKFSFPDRIGKAFNAFGVIFLVLGFILNQFGYAYVRNSNGWIGIDTLDRRDFQVEMYKKEKPPLDSVYNSIDSTKPATILMEKQLNSDT
jgi:hypothetical protein